MNSRIQDAYHASRNIYDTFMTGKSWISRLYSRLFWSSTDDNEAAEAV